MGYIYIALTISFTVYGQLILKWRIDQIGGNLPEATVSKLLALLTLIIDPFILSGLASAFIASLFWMAAMTKFDISFAYPFMSLSFALVFILSAVFFAEPITVHKVVGLGFIVVGIFISSQSI